MRDCVGALSEQDVDINRIFIMACPLGTERRPQERLRTE